MGRMGVVVGFREFRVDADYENAHLRILCVEAVTLVVRGSDSTSLHGLLIFGMVWRIAELGRDSRFVGFLCCFGDSARLDRS